MTPPAQQDGRRLRGERTREAVLTAAVAMASVDGLDGLSLGRLADDLGVSKSGLFAHWRDKEELQIATVAWARKQWQANVVQPAYAQPEGVRRLFAVHEARLAFYAAGILPGGCFFAAVEPELDDHPGAVRDCLVTAKREWLGFVRTLVEEAVVLGDLVPAADPDLLTFEIEALGAGAIFHARLVDRDDALDFSRRAVLHRLRALVTDPSLLPEG
jgi:AcrR family transcriptional regulator